LDGIARSSKRVSNMPRKSKWDKKIENLGQPAHPLLPENASSVEAMAHEYACAASEKLVADVRFSAFMTGFRSANFFLRGLRKEYGWIEVEQQPPEAEQWVILCGRVDDVRVVIPGFRHWDALRSKYVWRCAELGDYGEYAPIFEVKHWHALAHFPALPDMRDGAA
jgi:hypothetical protein